MIFTTSIKALDPLTGVMKTWCGPHVPGISFRDAERYCQENGLGYCKVTGILVAEIDAATGEREDFDQEMN